MKKFIKVTEKDSINGWTKVAVLLGELGPEASKPVMDILQFKPKEMRKITREMKKLGKFTHSDEEMVQRELLVLRELNRYGKAKGIISPEGSATDSFINSNKEEISSMVKNNPGDIANILKGWLGE